MKRILFLLVVVFMPFFNTNGQMIVADTAVAVLLQKSGAEQIIYYAQQLQDNINNIKHLADQVKNTERQVEIAMQNLASAKDIDSWDDFMDWYDRQIYVERMAIETAKGMNVTIGKKNYSIYDLEGISKGLDDTLINYWDKEFTEEQRREMWLGLGLSPANYAYVQPYRIKGREIARQLLTMSEIQNEKNKKTSEANKKDLDDLKADADKKPENQMGEKQVFQKLLAAFIRNTETLEDIAAIEAKRAEKEGIDEALKRPLDNNPTVSGWDTGFKKLKK